MESDTMAITREDVVWCYESLLGRKPESPETIQKHVASFKDFKSLVLAFVSSQEFQKKNTHPVFASPNRKAIDIETTGSNEDVVALKERIRSAWTHMGETRPHFSVLTAKHYLPELINDDAIERFYASGFNDSSTVQAILNRYGFTNPESKTCVEYGCGLGRVTLALAKMFKQVHGYDISQNHINLAEQRARDSGIHNAEFHLCSPDVATDQLEPCDVFFSCLVFQHNPPPLIRELITASLKSLRPGGIAIFQVPTYGAGYSFRIKDYLASPHRLNMEMHCFPQSEIISLIAACRCKLLEVSEDGACGLPGKWISNKFVVQRPADSPPGKRKNSERKLS